LCVSCPAARQHNVPVYGAILLNPALDKCLMVKGWKPGASWGFPKGKVRR
jgi:mRNA-decapping enzyme subunit 2